MSLTRQEQVTMQTETAVRRMAREKFEAIRALDEIDVRALEPALADLLNFVLQHPDAAGELKAEFLSQLEVLDSDVWWAIAYCMHTLRWPEVRDEVARQVAYLVRFREKSDPDEWRRMREVAPPYMTDLRRWNVIRAILESFEPDWSDRDFFVAYGGAPEEMPDPAGDDPPSTRVSEKSAKRPTADDTGRY